MDDIVQANLRAATTDAVGNAYNIGSGEATSIADLAELVRREDCTEGRTIAALYMARDLARLES